MHVLAAVYEANLEKMCKLSCIEVIMSVWVQMRLPGCALAHLPLGPASRKSSAIKCHDPLALPPSTPPGYQVWIRQVQLHDSYALLSAIGSTSQT